MNHQEYFFPTHTRLRYDCVGGLFFLVIIIYIYLLHLLQRELTAVLC